LFGISLVVMQLAPHTSNAPARLSANQLAARSTVDDETTGMLDVIRHLQAAAQAMAPM
jgi:hypothetical protein